MEVYPCRWKQACDFGDRGHHPGALPEMPLSESTPETSGWTTPTELHSAAVSVVQGVCHDVCRCMQEHGLNERLTLRILWDCAGATVCQCRREDFGRHSDRHIPRKREEELLI